MTAQEHGDGDRGDGHDPGRDEQGQVHPVGEGGPGLGRGGPGLGRGGPAQPGGDGDRGPGRSGLRGGSVTGDDDLPLVPGQPPAVFADIPAREDTDPGRLLAHFSHQYRLLAERSAVGWQTYRDGAAVDPDIAADWRHLNDMRRQAIRAMITRVPATALRSGLTPAEAGDTAWVIASPDTHDQLVRQAGYSYDQLEAWVRGTLSAALLSGG